MLRNAGPLFRFHHPDPYLNFEVKRMLGQRLEASLKSQTLPRLDGQDEESEVLESQFEILSIANSCPDLSVLEIETLQNESNNLRNSTNSGGVDVDVVDGIFYKNLSPSKVAASFRRSTSLSSLGVECVDPNHHRNPENCDGHVANNVHPPGRVCKTIGNLEKSLKKEGAPHISATDFVRTALRASHGGATGYLHKSISSPSVTQYFVGAVGGVHDNYQKSIHRIVQSDAHHHQHSNHTKRSFFRRKHKSKGNLTSSHPPTSGAKYNSVKMDEVSAKRLPALNGDMFQSLGFVALQDPSLGLQDVDAECWALSMSSEVVKGLDEKEVKRQEHMYELILTEKHHCLTLALMQHLFIGDMKKSEFSKYTKLMFPELNKLLEVHFSFLRRMRERQLKFRELGQPMDTLSDILVDQFTSDQKQIMIRLYGLLCASHKKSLEIFKSLVKDPKFLSLVTAWDKEPLLSRKNVRECLLLVAQRITKYPLLIEPILKTSPLLNEKDEIRKALTASKDLISKVDLRVEQRENLAKFCDKIDPKSTTIVGQKQRGKEYITSLPSRRLLFCGQTIVSCNRNSGTGAPGGRNVPCTLLILTDSLVFIHDFKSDARYRYQFVTPPGMVMLNNLIVRENAGQTSSLFLVLGTGSKTPEMIGLQVVSPPSRELWMEELRNAISKSVEESETCSDGDDETVDSSEISDMKTTKSLEELQEHDRNLLTFLRSRGRLIDSLRSEKPHHWTPNNFEGKDGLLSSLSAACLEVQKVINLWESNANSVVNRSASCAGEHGQGILLGLPKRADTFGGFDSQQRLALELPPCNNNKILMEIVIHLSNLCGEMFTQMIPNLMPSVYQSQHQLQRRMEDLREAQQRLETEKALWQQELSIQKENMDRERNELTTLKQNLQKEQEDITQQREQLYRKLEALQKQGMRSPLEPVSPLPGPAVVEKATVNPPPTRRPVSQVTPPTSTVPAGQPVNGLKNKQLLPLQLAASTSFKAGKTSSSVDVGAPMRNSIMGSFKGSSSGTNVSQNYVQQQQPLTNDSTRMSINQNSRSSSRNLVTPQVQQMLPLRLSEGNANKTASLPRGVGSRSVSSMMNQMDQNQQISQSHLNQKIRNSASASNFPPNSQMMTDNSNRTSIPSNSSFLYGPVYNAGTRHPNVDSHHNQPSRNGHFDNFLNSGNTTTDQETINISHRRSGSSPVPMSSVTQRPQTSTSEFLHHRHPFFRPRDDDPEAKILFL